jgi:hypothetical protein
MNTLTAELKQAVEQAGNSLVRLTDPETHRSYVLVSAEVYERLLDEADRREHAAFLRAAKKNAKARGMDDEVRLWSTEIIDWSAPSLQGTLPKLPGDLPHGLIAPPKEVVEQIAALDERLLREHGFTMNEQARVRELNRQTLLYFFDYLGYEVVYRETPDGPEVLAVGNDENLALTRDMNPEEQSKLKRWLP